MLLDLNGCPLTPIPRGIFHILGQLQTLYGDNYQLCCKDTLPSRLSLKRSFAPSDEISSCDDLLRSDSGAHRVTTSSLAMEVKAVTRAIQWLTFQRDAQITHAIILTDSMNPLQKVESGIGCPDGHMCVCGAGAEGEGEGGYAHARVHVCLRLSPRHTEREGSKID